MIENLKILAFCNDIHNYPEEALCDAFLEYGIKMMGGDKALNFIKEKKVNPENVYVMQEILAEDARKLIKLGAKPFILTSGEAPIYAPLLYDELAKIAQKFQHRILFRGAFEKLDGINEQNHILYFPTGSNTGMFNEIVPWNERKEMVMVVANKFCKLKFPTTIMPKSFIRKLKIFFSPSFRASVKNNFQTKRLNAIEFFGNLEKLDLYGGGWNNKRDISSVDWKKLKPILSKIYKGKCGDKIELISGYKFAIAFENIDYPGYITEKIIDCFVAGVIPLYLGASDIQEFIPKNCFIDVKDFESFEALNSYIDTIEEEKALEIINNGRNFLNTVQGQKYSGKYFVENIAELFNQEISK